MHYTDVIRGTERKFVNFIKSGSSLPRLPDDKATRKFEDEFIVKTEQGKYGKYKINITNPPAE